MNSGEKPSIGVRLVEVSEEAEGQRIDNFLLRRLKGVPKTRIYRLLRKGEVRVNKGRVKPSHKLSIGDQVRIPPVRTAESQAENPPDSAKEKIENTIIYEDDAILIVNKPSGMAVHGGSGVSFGVIEALRASRPNQKGLELVHRLDRDTSGCLAVAKKRSALRALQAKQIGGGVEKRYQALLSGVIDRPRFVVDAPLRKNVLRSGERVVRVEADGKPSRTHFRVLQRFADATLVEARLETGRTHQIRVHAQHVGHRILGDDKYGLDEDNQRFRELGLKRLFLHAISLAFRWPDDAHKLRVEAPLPDDLQQLLSVLSGK